jgi:hypothetical protein
LSAKLIQQRYLLVRSAISAQRCAKVPETSSNLAALVSGTARSRVLVTDTDVKLFKALSVIDAYRDGFENLADLQGGALH